MPRTSSITGKHPVIDLIAQRSISGCKPGHRDDEATLALVIEGGGMRGVVSGGMVTAIHDLGLTRVFDFVVGTSAGAMAGAFLVAGEPRMGTSIYYEDLIGRQWLDYRRALRRAPIVALDYLIDEVMVASKPLAWDRVITSDVPFYAVATRIRDWEPGILGDFSDRTELAAALRASARIPIIAGRPVAFRGEDYIDGSLKQAIPMATARQLGATHMLVLTTRPKGVVRSRPGFVQRRIVLPMMNRLIDGLGDVYGERASRYAEDLQELANLQAEGKAFPIQLVEHAASVAQLEQNAKVLREAAASGCSAVHEALTGRPDDSFGVDSRNGR